jgi:SpoIIAA-like
MPITMQPEMEGHLLNIHLIGKLTKADYQDFVPRMDEAFGRYPKVRMLVEMEDFEGWEPGAAWEDLKMGVRHFNHIERVAMVGDKKWEEWMATLCKPFTTAKVRYFPRQQSMEAHDWAASA